MLSATLVRLSPNPPPSLPSKSHSRRSHHSVRREFCALPASLLLVTSILNNGYRDTRSITRPRRRDHPFGHSHLKTQLLTPIVFKEEGESDLDLEYCATRHMASGEFARPDFSSFHTNSANSPNRGPNLYSFNSAKSAIRIRPVTRNQTIRPRLSDMPRF